jgi:hypothetical protein
VTRPPTGDPHPTDPHPTGSDPAGADPGAARRRAAQERRRRQVFGDVLDDSTLDDRPEAGPAPEGDRWLRDNVPPHHGD